MKKRYSLFLLSGLFFSVTTTGQTTYNDVAQIFYDRCTSCHHTGGIAPFPMMNYNETAAYSSSIDSDLRNNIMPPWSPDTTYTRFLHERIITSTEKNAILQWITDGSVEGDPALAPTAPLYGPMKYELCPEPTITVQIPTFTSNATPSTNNSDPYDCFAVSAGLSQDRWLRALEIVPGDRAIVHHVVVTVDTTGNATSDLSGNCTNQGGQFGIGGWSSGSAAVVFPGKAPLKAGIRIKAGSKLILQIHYAPGSGGQKDSTKLRMYYYPVGETGIRPVYSETWLQNWFMSIPANDSATYTATHAVGNTSISLFSTSPHSHNICTRLSNYADKSGSPTIPIIRINRWNYNWQGDYYFPKLLKIPNGYTIRGSHFYNNTPSNPYHPNPSNLATVTAGTKTADEMLFDAFLWLNYQTGDENINIDSLLACDTLLVCKPVFPGSITGTSTLCTGQTGVAFSCPIIDNAVTYTWAYSGTGATINGNGNSITVDFDANATAGNLTVMGNNKCGIAGPVSANYAISFGSGSGTAAAGSITGSSSVCSSQSGVSYSVGSISGASGYAWSYSGTGATINGSGTSVTINFASNATSGDLTVKGTGACGDGALSPAFAITVNALPSTPTISVVNNCGNSVLTSSSSTGNTWSPNNETTPSITVTTGGTYSVTVGSGGCSATSAGEVVNITPSPSITGITAASRCGAGTVTLGATASSGTITWYDALTGGTSLGTGTSFTTPSISTTTTYYVDATGSGCTSTPRTAVIATVSNGATATISGNATVCTGATGVLSIALTGTAPFGFTYGSATGSNPVSNITSSTYTVAAVAGTYTVGSVSDGSGCTGTGSGSATITENTAVTVSNITTACSGGNYTVEFDISGGDVASYAVTGGAGTITGSHFTSASITSATSYSFSVTDAYNCAPVSVTGNKNCGCAAEGTMSGGSSICPGGSTSITITFNGTAPFDFTYAIDGVSQTPVIGVNSPYTFTTSTLGAYTMVTVADASCTGSASGSATISQTLPTATLTGGGPICADGSTTNLNFAFTGTGPWDFVYTDGTTSSGTINSTLSSKVIPVSTAGTYSLTSVSDASCAGTVSGGATVIVNALPTVGSTVSPSATVCSGTSVTLNGTGASTYTWSDGKVDGQAFTVTADHTYTVTGTDANSCSNTATQSITVNALPTITTVANPSSAAVCTGGSITLSGSGSSTSYTWTGPVAVTDGVSFVATAGTYVVTGTDANNCTNTATRAVSVYALPSVGINATPSATVCVGGSITLSGTGASTYTWSDNVIDGTSFTITQTHTYTVTGTSNSCENTATKLIIVTPCSVPLGINQSSSSIQQITVYPNPTSGTFNVSISNANFKELSISVVNMLGKEVFTATDKNNSTDYHVEISLDGLSKGMYYLKLSTETETKITKLMIQ